MAQGILRFFGIASIMVGLLVLAFGLPSEGGLGRILVYSLGSAFLLFGAPLLGFAHALDVLEKIEENTRPQLLASNEFNPDEGLPLYQPTDKAGQHKPLDDTTGGFGGT